MGKEAQERKRKKRRDAGRPQWTKRDAFVLRWIGEQYAARLDQVQWLLGHPLSGEGTQKVVARWERLGWVKVARLRGEEPVWVWLTQTGLRQVRLPYGSRNMEKSLDDLSHLYAINEVRSAWEEEGARWVSERSLWHEVRWEKDKQRLHRPDGEVHFTDEQCIAIEVELSQKRPALLAEILLELVRGEGYQQLKAKQDAAEARRQSAGLQSRYDEIWYFGQASVRRQVMRERGRLVSEGALTEEEAGRIVVFWYPLAETEEEKDQEERENKEGLVSWKKAARTKPAERRRRRR